MQSVRKLVLFSDLDGTLLDRDTYSFFGAEEALERVKECGVPLVLATSKTWYEVEFYRQRLSNTHPFIVENGAAAFIPPQYFSPPPPLFRKKGEYLVFEVGTPYSRVREALEEIRRKTSLLLRGVGDMTVKEVADISNLDAEQAELSMMREYTEPFILEGERTEEALRAIREAVGGLGLRLTAGEKFLHLSGTHHKGELVARLSVLFRTSGDEVRTVGLGDGKNDVEMLAECDVAVLVRKKSGLLEEEIVSRVPGAFAYEAGPTGWNKAVIDLLEGRIP